MSTTFLKDFEKIIRECSYSNTYKMAWAKGIVECSNDEYSDEIVTIPLTLLASKMFKYYWDQSIYFNLYQSAPNQPPVILQEVHKIIKLYQDKKKDSYPVKFIRAINEFDENIRREYKKSIKRCVSNINLYVKDYFLNLNGERYSFYTYDNENIYMKREHLLELKENQEDLFDLINYRWSLMLEDYNSSPRIGKKVRIMDEQDVKRSSLKGFDKYLDMENEKHICFICHKEIEEKDLSRDHVIPWSFMYSDDLWNLVYVHKSCNSSKSNIPPSLERIKELKLRNKRLQKVLHEKYAGKALPSDVEKLDLAIEKDYVEQFYLASKGC